VSALTAKLMHHVAAGALAGIGPIVVIPIAKARP
jgi:hypothetical protein